MTKHHVAKGDNICLFCVAKETALNKQWIKPCVPLGNSHGNGRHQPVMKPFHAESELHRTILKHSQLVIIFFLVVLISLRIFLRNIPSPILNNGFVGHPVFYLIKYNSV